MNDKEQVMDEFQQVKQLGTTTVDLDAVAKQEKPVCLQKPTESQSRPGSQHQEEEIDGEDGDAI